MAAAGAGPVLGRFTTALFAERGAHRSRRRSSAARATSGSTWIRFRRDLDEARFRSAVRAEDAPRRRPSASPRRRSSSSTAGRWSARTGSAPFVSLVEEERARAAARGRARRPARRGLSARDRARPAGAPGPIAGRGRRAAAARARSGVDPRGRPRRAVPAAGLATRHWSPSSSSATSAAAFAPRCSRCWPSWSRSYGGESALRVPPPAARRQPGVAPSGRGGGGGRRAGQFWPMHDAAVRRRRARSIGRCSRRSPASSASTWPRFRAALDRRRFAARRLARRRRGARLGRARHAHLLRQRRPAGRRRAPSRSSAR